ncbi:hypothetical protein [Oricola sp.]|uniref:hypothetical protein n=1 Tax=Oricola sp. TaxID=1979950 RepID=UPI003BA89FA6
MPIRIYGAILLLGLAVAEAAWPGWNGLMFGAADITPDATRISVTIYLTAAIVVVFTSSRSGRL